MGDNVIIINAKKVKLTDNKAEDKKCYHHSGYLGGIKETAAGQSGVARYGIARALLEVDHDFRK